MKKFISKLVSFVMSSMMIIGIAVPGYYPEVAKIVKLDEENNLVYVQTAIGHVFAFYGIEDLSLGDLIGMIMKDNGTEIVYDDEIVDIIYGGRPEDFCDCGECGKTEEPDEELILEEIYFELVEIEPEEVYIEELAEEYLNLIEVVEII